MAPGDRRRSDPHQPHPRGAQPAHHVRWRRRGPGISSDRVRGFAVEDTAGVLMRFHRGAIATILMSDAAASGRSWEHTVHEDVNFATYPDEDCYHIVGTMGSLSVPTMRL